MHFRTLHLAGVDCPGSDVEQLNSAFATVNTLKKYWGSYGGSGEIIERMSYDRIICRRRFSTTWDAHFTGTHLRGYEDGNG